MTESSVQTDLNGARFHYVDTVDDAYELMRWLSTQAEIGLDTETTGLSPERDRVRLVQVGNAYEGWTIPFERWGGVFEDIVRRFTGYYRCHHAKFEYSMLKREGIVLPQRRMRCTLLMSHVLQSTGSLELKQLCRRYVDRNSGIGQRQLKEAMASAGWTWGTIPLDFPGYWTYAALDTVLTHRLCDVQYPKVLAEAPNAYELELAATWVTEKMERRGALVDREYTTRHAERLSEYAERVERWCKEAWGVYPGSDAEVAKRLVDDGVQLTKLTESRMRFSVDKEVLSGLDHPLAQAVLNRRKAIKLVSTYLQPYLMHSLHDGCLHPHINVVGGRAKNPFEPGGEAGVRTGRMSMDEPNLQNVPRHTAATGLIRDAIIAREGHTLVMCDFDQIEMRIFAHLVALATGDTGMRDAFLQPGDFFVNMAREITGDVSLEKSDPRRQMTKNAGYSKIYGAGLEKFALTARVPIETARPFLERFDSLYPGARGLQAIIERTATSRRDLEGDPYVRSPLTNRKHVADERRMYALVNYLIQGTAAEVLKMKGVELDYAGLGDYLVLPVHDEYVADVPEEVVRDAYGTLMGIMNDDTLFTVPITASVSTGKRWGSKEDYVLADADIAA